MPTNQRGREFAATFMAHHFHDTFEEVSAPANYDMGMPWTEAPSDYRRMLERVMARLVGEGIVTMGPAWREHLAASHSRVLPRNGDQ